MLNIVTLVGRLTRDPELRKTASGMSVAGFTLACDDSRKGANGEKTTIFIPVTVWDKTAEVCAKFTRKGDLVGISGRLTQRKYTNKDGVEVTSTEVNATTLELMQPKGENPTSEQQPAPTPTTGNTASIEVKDDDLPF